MHLFSIANNHRTYRVASIVYVKDHDVGYGIHCIVYHKPGMIQTTHTSSVLAESIYFGMDLEVVLASFSLFLTFCFIRHRIQIRQTAILIRNSVCHVAINVVVVSMDFIGAGYDIYYVGNTQTLRFKKIY